VCTYIYIHLKCIYICTLTTVSVYIYIHTYTDSCIYICMHEFLPLAYTYMYAYTVDVYSYVHQGLLVYIYIYTYTVIVYIYVHSLPLVCVRVFCCFGNLPILQVFGGVTRSSLLQEGHNPSSHFTNQQHNTAHRTYLFVVGQRICMWFLDFLFWQLPSVARFRDDDTCLPWSMYTHILLVYIYMYIEYY